ncbi:MAG: succinate dehydrogenase cytochrome b subunit [Myxococcales bacterium]|nr:succinate dehydrogenase cytochrome b subunit [Myxococcales bacterium]
MQRALTLTDTAIGKKVVMALSGAILVGFVIGHFLGNLNLYVGEASMNGYADKLHHMPVLLWGTRVLLLIAVTLHIVSAFMLWQRNQRARPVPYKMRKDIATTYAARTMYWSGPIILLFVVYHLFQFTFVPESGNVFANVVHAFSHPAVAAIYIVANLALGFHLFHGVFSAFQSLGANHPKYNQARHWLALLITIVVAGGNISFPIAVLTGVVHL